MAAAKKKEVSQSTGNGDAKDDRNENPNESAGEEEHHENNTDSKDESNPGKIFIGGLARETTKAKFAEHFSKYGKIIDSVIMKDRFTGNPRGFGFVTYEDPSVVDKVIADKHVIDGKTVEIKRTIPRSKGPRTKRIFVGGIPTSMTEAEFKDHFSKYGNVVEHQIMMDRATGHSRGFGFISFDSENAVEEILSHGSHIDLGGKKVEIKKAEPKKPSGPDPAFGKDIRPPYLPAGRGAFGDLYPGLGAGVYSSAYRTGAFDARPGAYGSFGSADYGSSYAGFGAGGIGGYRGDAAGYGNRFGPYSGGLGGYGSGMVGGYGDASSFPGYGSGSASYGSSYESGVGAVYGSSGAFGSGRGYGGSSGRYHPYAR